MKLLFHSCCAPCSVAPIELLLQLGIRPNLYWYNPNIHPFTEYEARKKALVDYALLQNIPLTLNDNYGLKNFVASFSPPYTNRCPTCYTMRLQVVAQYAAQQGFSHFTTSLLISPYQQHETLIKVADELANLYKVQFYYHDFRPLFRQSQNRARQLNLYRQKYCGCIFSEEERYVNAPVKKLKPKLN
jgi:predicted adenine nucleotide alpha hydrolase (AANH) superfamily ATPase